MSQAKAIGVSNAQLLRAEAAGQLRRVRRGVYCASGIPSSRLELIWSAALAAGPEVVVSHASAAAVHGFEYGRVGPVEVTVPRKYRARPRGVVVHRSTDLTRQDTVEKGGVLVTSAERALVDLAGRLGAVVAEKLLDEGLIARRWTVGQLQACLARARQNAPGRAYLSRFLDLRSDEPGADSVLEARALRALRPFRPFEVHFVLDIGTNVYVIDAAWPQRKLGVEIVGRAHRMASLSAFDRERRKLNALSAAGWKIVHLTAGMSAEEMVIATRGLLAGASGPSLAGKQLKSAPDAAGA